MNQPAELNRSAENVKAAVAGYRRRAIVAIQSVFLIGALVAMLAFPDVISVRIGTILSSLTSLASLWLALHNQQRPASLLLAIQFLVLPAALATSALGIYDSALFILPAGMVALAVIERPARVALFGAANVVAAGIVLLATLQGTIGQRDAIVNTQVALDGLTVMLVMVFSAIISVYVAHTLSRLLDELTANAVELEQRVARRTASLKAVNDDLSHALESLERAKDELVQGEKLAGLGSLVAGVAHELNTPIGNAAVAASTLEDNVTAFADQVAAGQLKRSDLQSFLEHCRQGSGLILRSVHRARDLVASFKQVAVDQASERRRQFDLHELAEDVLRTLRASYRGKPWQLNSRVSPGIELDSYPGPLVQVLSNLVENAVTHGFHGRDHGEVVIDASTADAAQLRISVRDDGRGIPAEALGRIFEPFFTTRLGQGGSGLGLAIVHNIVTKALGGQISVESTSGSGTRFTLQIPRRAPEAKED